MSTAKSLATSYLNNKRNFNANLSQGRNGAKLAGHAQLRQHQQRFKSSTSNLHQAKAAPGGRLKSISMSNLAGGAEQQANGDQQQQQQQQPGRMQRPASRNALDTIHNGMNAKYAQVQSKVLLHNIRPQQLTAQGLMPAQNSSRIPAAAAKSHTIGRPARSTTPSSQANKVPNERSALMSKARQLEEELERREAERETLRQELERERAHKAELVQQMKQELEEKLAEHDKQNEDYHHKLLEAYELADQNRRAADSVLSEARQRDEESRKKVDELEGQLAELKEFVAMKEEMTGKMYELREQIREERQRYEEQLKSLHQVFENEKIRSCQESKAAELMSVASGSQVLLEHNSNYFKRMKPALESSESLNKSAECTRCASAAGSASVSNLHQAQQQDMYGSKLSTRMKSSARSAWRSSKKLASSVITGGVGLSSCRQCKRRPSSPAPCGLARGQAAKASLRGAQLACQEAARADEHTSVVEVKSASCEAQSKAPKEPQEEQPGDRDEAQCKAPEKQQPSGLIRVDENNKLTIVTKFNELSPASLEEGAGCDSSLSPVGPPSSGAHSSPGRAPVSSASERSRCESSSSGRGSSDAGSTANSQAGDLNEERGQLAPGSPKEPVQEEGAQQQQQQQQEKKGERRHRRRSSLFKASRVFGGSQASLNKLKTFFSGRQEPGHAHSANDQQQEQQQQQQQQSETNAEKRSLAGGSPQRHAHLEPREAAPAAAS